MSDAILLSDSEIKIVEALRSLKPFERLEITADANGKTDSFLMHRSSKVMLVYKEERFVK